MALDSLIHLQEHAEREANIDIDHHQLPDHAIPQPSPRTSTGVRYSEEVPYYSNDGLIKNYHPN